MLFNLKEVKFRIFQIFIKLLLLLKFFFQMNLFYTLIQNLKINQHFIIEQFIISYYHLFSMLIKHNYYQFFLLLLNLLSKRNSITLTTYFNILKLKYSQSIFKVFFVIIFHLSFLYIRRIQHHLILNYLHIPILNDICHMQVISLYYLYAFLNLPKLMLSRRFTINFSVSYTIYVIKTDGLHYSCKTSSIKSLPSANVGYVIFIKFQMYTWLNI